MTLHCPMIHGGLMLDIKHHQQKINVKHCCVRNTELAFEISDTSNIWLDTRFKSLRDINLQETWAPGCENCQILEQSGNKSFRQGTLEMFGIRTDYSGPVRLDLMFDISCNLACRTCGPIVSTFWQKHLKQHGQWNRPIQPVQRSREVIDILKNIDLTNLELVVFCGGETLLGTSYWEIANAIADMVPDAKSKLILSFQTNGTQPINEKYFSVIEKFKLVKINVSLDGIDDRFEFLRWPASWSQVVDNLQTMKQRLPSNVMFLIEETISVLNLFYQDELESWAKNNFFENREGDVINHSKHMATGLFSLESMSNEYHSWIKTTPYSGFVDTTFVEDPPKIIKMIDELTKVDAWRNQNWTKTFPEVAEFYSRYL